jgi:transcription antitermination factor NusG
MIENEFWYVIYTRPRWEKKIAAILDQKGIENYCPLNKVERRWSDRKKTIMEPLFKGYIFIKIEEPKKWDIKQIDGIVNYVYYLGKPARIRESEINNIKFFLKEFTSVEVINNKIVIKDAVIINEGVLMNYKGMVIDVFGNKARVQIDSLGIRLSALFEKSSLSPIG